METVTAFRRQTNSVLDVLAVLNLCRTKCRPTIVNIYALVNVIEKKGRSYVPSLPGKQEWM